MPYLFKRFGNVLLHLTPCIWTQAASNSHGTEGTVTNKNRCNIYNGTRSSTAYAFLFSTLERNLRTSLWIKSEQLNSMRIVLSR